MNDSMKELPKSKAKNKTMNEATNAASNEATLKIRRSGKEEMQMQFRFTPLPTGLQNADPTALTHVFIDYDYLYISSTSVLQSPPDLKTLVDEFMSMGQIKSIKAFGDFSNPALAQEKNRIRTMTSHVVDCGSETGAKKDVTDFIMLNEIYQTLIENEEISQYILVTGDGHFSSVATFCRVLKKKTIGIYGIRTTLSRQLYECSSWAKYMEISEDDYKDYVRLIAMNLKRVEDNGKFATFLKTCEVVSSSNGVDYEACRRYLQRMISEGMVSQEYVSYTQTPINRLVLHLDEVERFLSA